MSFTIGPDHRRSTFVETVNYAVCLRYRVEHGTRAQPSYRQAHITNLLNCPGDTGSIDVRLGIFEDTAPTAEQGELLDPA
ncbi:MAG: hypothetical protein K8U57_02060 [Planctomycetes bacterium]|nr:hypothetical protein [Planctomycetota bacterium]